MEREEIHANIDAWVAAGQAGALSEEEKQALAEHLEACPACREVADQAAKVSGAVSRAMAEDRPDAGFEDRLVEGFRKNAPRAAPASPARRGLLRFAAAAAVLVVAGLGLLLASGLDANLLRSRSGSGVKAHQDPRDGIGSPALENDAVPAGRENLAGKEEGIQAPASEEAEVMLVEKEMKKLSRSKRREARRPSAPGDFYGPDHNTESYSHQPENPFVKVADDPRSTFSIDVDTASYANVRRFLNRGALPQKGAVRIEEMINYFGYDYAPPEGDEPFAVHMEVARCPWNLAHRLVRIGLKGKVVEREARPPSNLVFLIDVSGSMQSSNKLPLLRKAMKLLARQLTEDDFVTIVTYAGRESLVLPSTPAAPPGRILAAIDSLRSGGSTHGSAGIRLAYEQARTNFVAGGTNRVILATDGDFNVGVTSNSALVDLIRKEAKSGVFLTVLGFGMGNYKDDKMELLADKGNGNYAYIDTLDEAKKVLVHDLSGTLVTIAKDVKIQVEFNPVAVDSWRLIGYENRVMAHQDFNDDTKDAGEIGAGHTVTALYEVVPASEGSGEDEVDPLKFQEGRRPSSAAYSGALLWLKLRHKLPEGETSRLQEFGVQDSTLDFASASADFRFASAVAAFGMLLRDSPHKGTASFDGVKELAAEGLADDPHGLRAEFVRLVDKAKALSR